MDNKTPSISVITVCRNSAETIGRTFQSILDQGFDGVESIVIDGVSTDGTLDIVEDYQARFKARGLNMTVISEPDEGIYDAMNKGLKQCRGELVGILNSDDQYEAGALEHIHCAAQENPKAGIIYGFLRQVISGRELSVYRYNFDFILSDLSAGIQAAVQHPTCFVRRSVYDSIGTFDEGYRLAADYDFLLRAKRKGVKFLGLDEVIATFNSGGVTDTTPLEIRMEERYRAQLTNGLISQKKYDEYARLNKLRRLRQMKAKVMRKIFRTGGAS